MPMTMKHHVLLALTVLSVSGVSLQAQQFGIAGRVGTLGLGAEAAAALTDRVVLRGGMSVTPFEPSMNFSDLDVTLELPTWYNVGVDIYLNGAMRFGGGILFKGDDPRLTGEFTTNQDIGGQTFTPQEIGKLVAVIDSKARVPYLLVGFGKHTAPGIGLFLDMGVAFQGTPNFLLSTEGGTLSDDTGPLRTALDAEATEFEQDAGSYLRFWPILNVGLRIGID